MTSHDHRAVWRAGIPAIAAELETLATRYPGLPREYLAFLRAEDGSEGELGIDPGWIQFWPAATVAARNGEYKIAELLPRFIGFASDGGGELLAFDTRTSHWTIYRVPFVPMDECEAIEVATDFATLARSFGVLPPAG
ncbi:MAG TPA: SMI1/KNR4 family protein [Gemmatimonadaceae bacterium]|jgi:hypothetical protein